MTPRATLWLHRLKCSTHLGWEAAERNAAQSVFIDVGLRFPSVPAAAATDRLEDTVNYAHLADLATKVCDGEHRLLEHLTNEIYRAIRTDVPREVEVGVRVVKQAPIANLEGGASFLIADGDFSSDPGWGRDHPSTRPPVYPS